MSQNLFTDTKMESFSGPTKPNKQYFLRLLKDLECGVKLMRITGVLASAPLSVSQHARAKRCDQTMFVAPPLSSGYHRDVVGNKHPRVTFLSHVKSPFQTFLDQILRDLSLGHSLFGMLGATAAQDGARH